MRAIAAPGRLTAPDEDAFDAEVARAEALAPASRIRVAGAEPQLDVIFDHLLPAETAARVRQSLAADAVVPPLAADAGRQERLVRGLSRFTQRLIVVCDAERAAGFWGGLPL